MINKPISPLIYQVNHCVTPINSSAQGKLDSIIKRIHFLITNQDEKNCGGEQILFVSSKATKQVKSQLVICIWGIGDDGLNR